MRKVFKVSQVKNGKFIELIQAFLKITQVQNRKLSTFSLRDDGG